MQIERLTLSYPDFVLNTVIEPDQIDTNNLEIVTKTNLCIDQANAIDIKQTTQDTIIANLIAELNQDIVDITTLVNSGVTANTTLINDKIAIVTALVNSGITANTALINDKIAIITTSVNNAISIANGANTKSDSANTKADVAIVTANNADTNATNAVSTANSASTSASASVTIATDAKSKAIAVETDYNTVKSALLQAVADVTLKVDKTYVDSVANHDDIVILNGTGIIVEKANKSALDTTNTNVSNLTNSVAMSLAESPQQRVNHYYIGENQKFKTINEAWNEYKNLNDFNIESIFHIYKGIYKEKIIQHGKVNVSFIGEDKKLVIWKTTSGYYADAPIAIQGNVLLKGITFIADHSENPSYAWGSETSGAYAVHVVGDNDLGGSKITIEDCILRSYQNSGLGSGTGDNHTIEVINSEIYNHSDVSIGGTSLTSGALLYHSSALNGLNQKLKLKNVKVHSDNGLAIHLQTYGNNDEVIELECINVNCSSNIENIELVKIAPDLSSKIRITSTKNSYGNNIDKLNISKTKISEDGYAMLTTNLNDVDNFAFVKCVGSQGGLNTPTISTYIAICYPYQYSTNVSHTYSIQYAWDILSNFKKYKRTKIGGVWGSWVVCFEEKQIESNITGNVSTDFNNVTSAKFYGTSTTGCLNTPNANGFHNGFYVGEEISYSATFRLQYAWAIQDGYKKYKRSKTITTWTAWVLCNE